MESIQPVRPPMSQQPPQRIDSLETDTRHENKESSVHSKKDLNIPDVDISLAYKRRALKHRIECGHRVKIGNDEIEELKLILGSRKCQMYKPNTMASCVVCDEQCIDGEFAVETVLFIPNKNDPAYDNLGRFRTELPRIACHDCASEYASIDSINTTTSTIQLSLGRVWQNYQNGELNQTMKPNQNTNSVLSAVPNLAALNNSTIPLKGDTDDNKISGNTHQHKHTEAIQQAQVTQQQQQQQAIPHQHVHPAHSHSHQQQQQQQVAPQGMNINENMPTAQTMPLSEAERDPFDDGFLICTQLVKTGGADQGGLQVGDVFVEFGHYSKKRFPGLKSIANLVRRSAGKEINVVVWRKLEQMNAVEDDGTGRTVFQKLALKLKPLQSHDADGGGVLGAVINTYPLPEMKN